MCYQNAPEDGTGSYEPIATYWLKYARKTSDRDNRAGLKQLIEKEQEEIGRSCSVCHKQDSDAVTLRVIVSFVYMIHSRHDIQ